MADKHTKKELFTFLLVLAGATEADEWIIAGIEHEIDLLDKRSGVKGTNAKRDAEKKATMDKIVSVLTDEPQTATDVALAADFTVQKVTANMKPLVADGRANRTEVKGKAYFTRS